ncbi:MAG TPA: hypothetical protein VJ869_17465, partial [Sphaerochaeta sp.]|nr:hypothetical protein [Sphaerochaeta sp.]
MTDIQELMKSSDTMRMLKMGNPERSKDFNLPKMDIGLFDIEKIVKEPLEKAVYNSPDPNGAIANFDTAMMLNNLGVDMESAHNMANSGFSSSVTGIDTADKTFGEAFGTTIKHASWQEMRGVNTSLYMLSGDFKFMENAHEYSDKVFKNPIRNEYGELGDLVLSGVQPTMSMMKFMSTAALVSWLPAGMAAKFGGAGLKALAAGGKVAAPLINMIASGYSQGGNVMYDVMQVKDIDGKALPWDTTTGQALFHALSLTMGVVEVGSMEFFPWYRQINSYFTTGELAKQLERGLVAGLKNFFWEGAKGTASEAMEEGVQTGLGLGFENILRAMAKKKGAKFEQIPIGDIARDMARDTWEAGKSMVLTSFLTAGIGQSVVGIKMNAQSSKNFNRSKTSFTIDKSFIDTKTDPNAPVIGTLNKDQQAEAAEPTILEPIKIVQDGHRAIPINAEELQKARDAESRGSEVYEVEVVDSSPIGADQQETLINQAALSTDGQILDENTIVYETTEDRDRGVFLLAPNVESYKKNDDSMDLIIRDENGEISTISLKVAEEGMELTSPDASKFTNPYAPYSLARVTADQALVWQEKNIIRKAIGDAVAHTKGRISPQALEASVDAMKIVSDTIGVPVDELLKNDLVFKLVTSEDGERGWTEDNITVDGKKQYTIGITERGDAKTIIHEIGHFLRGTATKEQLAEFTQHYGQGKEGVWIEDINQVGDKFFIGDTEYATRDEAFAEIEVNEERFAEDFVTYFATGIAPTEGLAKVFERMKNVLKAMMEQYKWEIDPEVKAAFDSLFTGEIQRSLDIDLGVGPDRNVLFDKVTNKEIDKQYFEALERGDTEAAQKIIDNQAKKKGYISDQEYRMQHKAPNSSDDFSANLANIEETDLIPKDYWTHPQYYLSDGERYSFYKVKQALDRYKENGKANLKLYRAIDKNIKEEQFRNGDWVTPDRQYAADHGSGIPGGYKIISQSVPLENIYWDVNSIAELGYDDGEAYAYKDTKNNKKLTDVITRDFDGEIIPPSKRFNYREYYKFFDKAPQVGSEEFNDLFENTEVIDENGKPMMVYHGSPNAGIESFNTDLIYASNSEETSTDFSYEQLPGSSNFTF